MENQVLGLAEAINRLTPVDIEVKRISIRQPWESLPGPFWGNPFHRLAKVTDQFGQVTTMTPAWPDLWLACGRRTLPFSKYMKRHGHSFVVQTQDPRGAIDAFDLIIPPEHDGLVGDNVLPILGSPNRVTQKSLTTQAAKLGPHLAFLSEPKIAVLIGGNSRAYKMSAADIDYICKALDDLAKANYGLMITESRRTPAHMTERLQHQFATNPNVFLWEGRAIGDIANPYQAMLGLAAHILVTADSTNMVTEAATTGKPVHILPLTGGSEKFSVFHTALENYKITRPFSLPLQEWEYPPLNETEAAAKEILSRISMLEN
ncbi:MAG: mitochondrial fission ELM1 family protein [bacterium]